MSVSDNTRRRLNLVFQGGGIRGIVYAGVLEQMPSNLEIHAVGGTSAGAIVAALLAIGKTGQEIKTLLENRKLYSLLDKTDLERAQRIKILWQDAQAQLAASAAGNKATKVWKLGLFCKNHWQTVTRDLAHVWNRRGLHDSTQIRQWLDEILENKKFANTVVEDLRIVAADASKRGYITYNKRDFPGTSIAEAVHASISIPLFFSPFRIGPMYLVDGGILSNYPSYQFAREPYPTIGFRIVDVITPSVVDSPWSYLKSLLLTMVEAHDKEREKALDPLSFKTYTIAVPPGSPPPSLI